jgi:hypothetical protein
MSPFHRLDQHPHKKLIFVVDVKVQHLSNRVNTEQHIITTFPHYIQCLIQISNLQCISQNKANKSFSPRTKGRVSFYNYQLLIIIISSLILSD